MAENTNLWIKTLKNFGSEKRLTAKQMIWNHCGVLSCSSPLLVLLCCALKGVPWLNIDFGVCLPAGQHQSYSIEAASRESPCGLLIPLSSSCFYGSWVLCFCSLLGSYLQYKPKNLFICLFVLIVKWKALVVFSSICPLLASTVPEFYASAACLAPAYSTNQKTCLFVCLFR